jgi:hypothetical protein
MTTEYVINSFIGFFFGTQTGFLLLIGGVMSVVEVSKIRLNPWSYIGRLIQRLIGVKELSERMDRRDAVDARSRIIRFDDECMNQMRHSKAMFDAVLIDCDFYNEYCKTHPGFRNSIAADAIDHIKEIYHDCKATNDFLFVRKGKENAE